MSSGPVVIYDRSTNRFILNPRWAPSPTSPTLGSAGSVHFGVDQRREILRGIQGIGAVQDYKETALKVLHEDDPTYKAPDTGDPEKDLRRIQADMLNLQVQAEARRAGEVMQGLKEKHSWRGRLASALDNPTGHVLLRGMDLLSRFNYATAASTDAGIRAARGEYQHKGYEALPDSYTYGKNAWRNVETGKVETHPEWGTGDSSPSNMTKIREGLKAGWGGFEGKNKTTWGTTFRSNDVLRGKPGAVAGFAMDVATDPLTYYHGANVNVLRKTGEEALSAEERDLVRQMARDAADASVDGAKNPAKWQRLYQKELDNALKDAGAYHRPTFETIDDLHREGSRFSSRTAVKEAVDEALKSDFWKTEMRKIGVQARKAYKIAQEAAGEEVTKEGAAAASTVARTKAAAAFVQETERKALSEYATRMAMETTKKYVPSMFGKELPVGSVTLGTGAARTGEVLRNSKLGSELAKRFRTDAEVGQELHRLRRAAENVNSVEWAHDARDIKRTFKSLGLSKEERIKVTMAIEQDSRAGLTPKMLDAYDYAKTMFDRAWQREMDAGARKAADYQPGYMYHHYMNPELKRGMGYWMLPTKGSSRVYPTLAKAAEDGARPLTDIADILVHRTAKSYRTAMTWNLMNEIQTRFGIDLSKDTVRNRAMRELGQGADASLIQGSKIGTTENGISYVGKFFDKGVYFDRDVAATLDKMGKMFQSEETVGQFAKLFDAIQARIKFLQTAPNPGFHVRNSISDAFMNFLDGVTNPRRYDQALRVMQGRGTKVVLENGHEVFSGDIKQLYEAYGLQTGFFHADARVIEDNYKQFLTGAEGRIRSFSENREDLFRYAHFIDAMEKTKIPKGMSVAESQNYAAEMAAQRVKKFNFDYQDLTHFEKKVMRRVIPFYTFMRKNIPLMMEMYFSSPGRMLIPTKAMRAMSEYMGNGKIDEPLPGMISGIPEWIAQVPGINAVGASPSGDQVIIQPDLPINQLNMFDGITQGQGVQGHIEEGLKGIGKDMVIDNSTDVVRLPYEYVTQKDLSTGQDKPAGLADTIINSFPAGKIVLAQSNIGNKVNVPLLFAAQDTRTTPSYTISVGGNKIVISETIANYLTGLSAHKVTPERMKSELRRRQDIIAAVVKEMKKQQIKNAQDEWNKAHPDLVDQGN